MKKIIDIPDDMLKELKIMAVKNDNNLKQFIENLILNHYNISNMTEMACEGIEDGQSVRFVWNYLLATYNGIENNVFDYGSTKFEKLEDFIIHVKEVCEDILYNLNSDENE